MKKKNGYVLISVLVIMMVMLVITYYLADALFSEAAIARNQKGATIAFHLAEGGVQEAIWRIVNDVPPGTRDTFLNEPLGKTDFDHHPALLTNGSYDVTIQNTAKAVATITATGYFTMGLKTAQRRIVVNITQATIQPPYDDEGAMFSHSAGGESTGDLEFDSATVNIYGGTLHSGRDISFKGGTYNVEKGIVLEGNIKLQQNPTVNCNCSFVGDPLCSSNPGCTPTITPMGEMPMIDFDSASANSYKNQALAHVPSQYFTSSSNFFTSTGFGAGQTKTFEGVVYIEGGITLDQNRVMNMNGVLASSGSITIGGSQNGTLNVSPPAADKPSGALTTGTFSLNSKGNFSGTALIYAAFRTIINSSSIPVTFTGGILSRRVNVGSRTLTIYFDKDVINDTLEAPTETPVIEIYHWEEEY